MKTTFFYCLLSTIASFLLVHDSYAQEYTSIPPSNRAVVGLEKNLLFGANYRYTVTQTGRATLDLSVLFNGSYSPSYSSEIEIGSTGMSYPTPSDSTVITIEGFPVYHVQGGAWFGWTTRGWPAEEFVVEGWDTYYANGWVELDHVTGNTAYDYMLKLPGGGYSKFRITIKKGYQNPGANGRFGISEVFYLHPELARAYDNLAVQYDKFGNVAIGNTSLTSDLTVNGKITSKGVKVKTNVWADFVFSPTYRLRPLSEVESFIEANGHLPEIPSEEVVKANGVDIGEMDAKLLQKIEELTLYVIDQEKRLKKVEQDNARLKKENAELKK